MTDDPLPPPDGIDPNTPSSARVYDYLLGGKDNYASDRAVMRQYTATDPEAPLVSRANRAFGIRAARFIAERGITQFLDLGSGIPTSPPNVHDTVWAITPTARVVYVDHDPVMVAHSAALRSRSGHHHRPGRHPLPPSAARSSRTEGGARSHHPVGVLAFNVLQSINDPAALLARYSERIAVGSFLGISHMSERSHPDAIARTQHLVDDSGFPTTTFRDAQVWAMIRGFTLVDAGLVEITDWRPIQDYPPSRLKLVGGVGQKIT